MEGDINFDSNATRENLLDVILDRLAKAGRNTIFTRVVYVARLSKREQQADGIKGRQEQQPPHAMRVESAEPLHRRAIRAASQSMWACGRMLTLCCHVPCMQPRSPCVHADLLLPRAMHAAFHQKLVERHDPNNEVTGMLLIYPACMIHLLEVSTEHRTLSHARSACLPPPHPKFLIPMQPHKS